MEKIKTSINTWILALVLAIVVAGCGNNNHIPIGETPVTDSKAITTYSLNGADGIIDESAKTISVAMPQGTDLTNLTATYTTTGKAVALGTSQQISAGTPNDFSVPLTYRVSATDNSTTTYTVRATVDPDEVSPLALAEKLFSNNQEG